MTSISLEVPIVGQKNTTEEPKVGNSITTIQSFLNGSNLDGTTNIKAEGVAEANLTAAVVTKLNQKASGLELKKQSGSATGESGTIYLMETNAATLTLTATATANKQVGIICKTAVASVTLKAGAGAKIFGDFLAAAGVASCVIAENQHVIVEADGTNWWIIAGEPKREQTYTALTEHIILSTAEFGEEPSSVRPSSVTGMINAPGAGTEMEIVIGVQTIMTNVAIKGQLPLPAYFIPPGKTIKFKNQGAETVKVFLTHILL